MINEKRDLEELAAWQLLNLVRSAKLKPADKSWLNRVRSRFVSSGAISVKDTTRLRDLCWANRKAINLAEEARERALKSMALEASGKTREDVRKAVEEKKAEDEGLGF